MTRLFIALFRGLNVGGSGRISMKELGALIEGLGLEAPRTYVQSGNILFRCEAARLVTLVAEIETAMQAVAGITTTVLLLRPEELRRIMDANPFPGAEAAPTSLHLFFFACPPPSPDLARLEALRAPSESFRLGEGALYLHAPEGIGRSKLGAGIEKSLGVPVTARNWRTATELLAMSGEG